MKNTNLQSLIVEDAWSTLEKICLIKSDTGHEFTTVIIRPNKELIICLVACYIAPNKRDQGLEILNRIEAYTYSVERAYANLTIIILTTFWGTNSLYSKKFQVWTFMETDY